MGRAATGVVDPGSWLPEITLTPQESGTEALLQAISPVTEATVWASGHEGTYARTLDGGDAWSATVMPGAETLQFRDVEAFDARTAFLMSAGSGDRSRIYRTDDGGRSWVLQYTARHPDAFLDCLAFWDRERGLAYGDAVDGIPFILHTEDGGAHWIRVPAEALPPALEGEGGFAASGTCVVTREDGRAWIATGNGSRARVLKTADWGKSWEVQDVPVTGGGGAGLTTIQMAADGLRGLALGGIIGQDSAWTANVASTQDGGGSWERGDFLAFPGPVYGSALVEPSSMRSSGETAPLPAGADSSETTRALAAVAVGPRGMGWSRDFGRTWIGLDTRAWWAVAFATPEVGWAVGPSGRVVRITLGARTPVGTGGAP